MDSRSPRKQEGATMKIIILAFILLFASIPLPNRADETPNWYTYTPPKDPSATSFDLSFLNEHPAGRHGFVRIKDGHFIFEDGTPARFWGTNFEGADNFPSHEQADALALRLSRLGVNLLRLHLADNGWIKNNFFDPKANNTLTLDPGQVDKFDYLVSALKKNGIYIYPDWLVFRQYREGDGVAAYKELGLGAKGVAHFDPRVIELNKLYAKEVLGHVNTYTGLALKDDPVYVGNEIVNESSLFCSFGEQKFPQYYWDELQKLYEAWGGQGALTHFKWDGASDKMVPILNPENAEQTMKFYLYQMAKTNLEMKQFLSELSPHALLAGSNMGLPVLGNTKADSVLDFMDAHFYWDYPQVDKVGGDWHKVEYAPLGNSSELKKPFGSFISRLSNCVVIDKPLIVTEWNVCFPNEYRAEGPVLMASYGSLQDWGGILQFEYLSDPIGTNRMKTFAINRRPDNEPVFQAGALIFRNNMLKTSDITVAEKLSDDQVMANGMKSNWLYEHNWLPYTVKVGKEFTGSESAAPADLSGLGNLHQDDAKRFISSTGEETLNYGKGILKLDSPQVQGFTGFIGTGDTLGTTDFSMTLSSKAPFASVLAIALDGKPIHQSHKLLVVAVSKSMNSGQTFNADRHALTDPGNVPILMEGVRGTLQIRVDAALTVTSLDSNGKKGTPLTTHREGTRIQFDISPSDQTSYYLLESPGP